MLFASRLSGETSPPAEENWLIYSYSALIVRVPLRYPEEISIPQVPRRVQSEPIILAGVDTPGQTCTREMHDASYQAPTVSYQYGYQYGYHSKATVPPITGQSEKTVVECGQCESWPFSISNVLGRFWLSVSQDASASIRAREQQTVGTAFPDRA